MAGESSSQQGEGGSSDKEVMLIHDAVEPDCGTLKSSEEAIFEGKETSNQSKAHTQLVLVERTLEI
jgi:hypothetical protein